MRGAYPENPLQRARRKANISQEEAADKLSCDTRTLQRYEAGRQQPKLDTIKKMAKLYECEIADLFHETAVYEGEKNA